MLTAVSSELPAYLLPPKAEAEGRAPSTSESGPDARVSVSTRGAAAAQAHPSGSGLYGPDGQFVESTAQRTGQQPATQGQSDPVAYDGASSGASYSFQAEQGYITDSPDESVQIHPASKSAEFHGRDLGLSDFDATIPPAAKEELRSLADRIERKVGGASLEAREYRQMAELMSRVGRHDEAMAALAKAEELEKRGQTQLHETSQESTDATKQEAGAAEKTAA